MSQDSKKQDRTHERQYTERVEAALAQLAAGGVVVVVDDFGRENEGDLIAVSELTTEETVNFMVTHARGMVCQPITAERARELELPLMVSRVTDPHRTAFTVTVTTGTPRRGSPRGSGPGRSAPSPRRRRSRRICGGPVTSSPSLPKRAGSSNGAATRRRRWTWPASQAALRAA